jgi:hypothetical protein
MSEETERQVTATEGVKKKIKDLKFEATRNAVYHSWRKHHFDSVNRIANFLVVLLGAAAFSDLANEYIFAKASQIFGGLAAVVGAAQLVFDFGVRAREHDFLQRRFYELAAEISETPEPTEAAVAQWQADLLKLYAEEPTQMRALDAMAYNAVAESIGRGQYRVKITWFQTLFSQILPFDRSKFPYVSSPIPENSRTLG